MYIVSLKYFDSSGHFLGDGEMLSPGKSQRALMEYVSRTVGSSVGSGRPIFTPVQRRGPLFLLKWEVNT